MIQRRKKIYTLALVWASTLFLIWPVLRHRTILAHWEWRTRLATILSYGAAALLCFLFYRSESRRGLDRSRATILILLIFLLTCFVNQIHYSFVDKGAVFGYEDNLAWQEGVQIAVVKFDPGAIPHTYRFLPNAIVLWMQLCRVNYDAARDIYRLIVNLLLFYALYRFARLYTDYLGGVLALLLTAAVYPMSFERYAGQLTDPMSHLAFLLAFICLETGEFEYFLSTLVIGSLAKETILAMGGFYVLFCRRERRYVPKAFTLCLACVIAYFGVRFLVLHGAMNYFEISAVKPHHAIDNLFSTWAMPTAILFAYVLFLLLAWKETPAALKRLALYLIPVLFISNLFFGWLYETRNYMPAVFVLAVIAARYISRRLEATRPLTIDTPA